MGIQADDIIVGLDHQELDMTMEQFLGHVRRNYLIGDRVTLNVICQGKRLELAVRLR